MHAWSVQLRAALHGDAASSTQRVGSTHECRPLVASLYMRHRAIRLVAPRVLAAAAGHTHGTLYSIHRSRVLLSAIPRTACTPHFIAPKFCYLTYGPSIVRRARSAGRRIAKRGKIASI